MLKNNPYSPGPICHLLITSLFYPAVLGGLFYTLLDECYFLGSDVNRIMIIILILGIIISFSIDFLYTWVSKDNYNWKLFILDIFILLLLFVGYKNLLDGLVKTISIRIFFLSFTIMHLLFLIWDLFLIPKMNEPTP